MHRIMALAAILTLGSSTGCEEEFKPPPSEKKETKAAATKPAPTPSPPPSEEKPAEPAKEKPPEPTTPKEIEVARNTAILDGRFEDAMRYCGMEDLSGKDEQSILGCVLSACRLNDPDKAKQWSKHLSGALLKEARKVCSSNKVYF